MKVYCTVDCSDGFAVMVILATLHIVIVAFEFSRSIGARLDERHNDMDIEEIVFPVSMWVDKVLWYVGRIHDAI